MDRLGEGVGHPLTGVRVVEIGDERGAFCGKLLAGLGADVVTVEPPDGSRGRRIGPFYQDEPSRETSLFWWHYNQGKRGVTLDIESPDGLEALRRLLEGCDVLVESLGPGGLDRIGLPWDRLHDETPGLIVLSLSDFGFDGPWAGYEGSDLVMLALGGQMMISGYPSVADGVWDTPPIAPQPHQSSHIAGCLGAMDVLAALAYREETGRGQRIDLSYHAAANNCTENNLSWYMVAGAINERGPLSPEMFGGDGKYMQVMLGLFPGEWERVVAMLDEFGMAEDLKDPRYADPTFRKQPEARQHVDEVVQAFLATQTVEDAFHAAQRHGVIWAPIREAHESLDDPHFALRGSFTKVEHPELGRSFDYPGAPWVSEGLPWRNGPRAPFLGEHNGEVLGDELGLSADEIEAAGGGAGPA